MNTQGKFDPDAKFDEIAEWLSGGVIHMQMARLRNLMN